MVTRVVLDATPLLGPRTGVGRYVEHLVRELAALGTLDLVATAFTLRGAGALPAAVPPGVRVRHRPAPARALQAAWERLELPPVEWLAGRADVVHGTNFVLPPLRRAAGVLTVHDLSYLRYPETVAAASLRYRTLVPRGVRRAALVLTPSHAVAAEVRDEYGLGDRVRDHPAGVDEDWFAPARRPGRAAGGARAAGAVPPLRRHGRAAQGPADPAGRAPGAARGRPGHAAAGAGRAARLGSAPGDRGLPAGAVVAAGYLESADLRRLVAGSGLLAFPSVYEGFGLPPLEAFAAGVPVVASDLPVVREVTGELATLAPVGDEAALAGALRAALARPPDRAALRERARGFSWAGCAARTAAAYQDALAG